MYKVLREDEDVVFIECGDEEVIGGGDEFYVQCVFYDEEDFGGVGMCVWDVDVVDGEVEVCEFCVECVEFWECLYEYLCCFLLVVVVCVVGDVQVVVDEVVYGDCG